jgi:hypothetical protein
MPPLMIGDCSLLYAELGGGAASPASRCWVEDAEWTARMEDRWSHAAVAAIVHDAITAFGADK